MLNKELAGDKLEEVLGEWLNNPVTLALKQALRDRVQAAKDNWADGEYLGKPLVEARATGYIEALRDLIDLDAEGLEGTLNHE
jgi:hypothetical protein